MTPLVTIGIPCYNAAPFIKTAIESALAQTYPNIEVIVVDDGSSDTSLVVASAFGDRVKVIRSGHRGSNYARNTILQESRGEWIQFLDADDRLEPEKIARQFAETENGLDADVLYSPVWIETTTGGKSSREISQSSPGRDLYAQWLSGHLPQTGGCLWRTSALKDIDGWRIEQPCCQEHELYLRSLKEGHRWKFAPTPGAVYRIWSEETLCRKDPRMVIRVKTRLMDHLHEWMQAKKLWKEEHAHIAGRACLEMARTLARHGSERSRPLPPGPPQTRDDSPRRPGCAEELSLELPAPRLLQLRTARIPPSLIRGSVALQPRHPDFRARGSARRYAGKHRRTNAPARGGRTGRWLARAKRQPMAERFAAELPITYEPAQIASAAQQRNQGARRISTPLAGFFDDDMVLAPDVGEKIAGAFTSDTASQIGGIAARIRDERHLPPKRLLWLYYRLQAGFAHPTYGGKLFGPVINCYPSYDEAEGELVQADWLNAGCVFYRTELFLREGFPQFEGYSFMEDVHLSARIAKTHRLYFHAGALSDHRWGSNSLKRDLAQIARMRIRKSTPRRTRGPRALGHWL